MYSYGSSTVLKEGAHNGICVKSFHGGKQGNFTFNPTVLIDKHGCDFV